MTGTGKGVGIVDGEFHRTGLQLKTIHLLISTIVEREKI